MINLDTNSLSGEIPRINARPELKMGLLIWGDLIEDFLDSIGVSLETFCTEMTGGWFFGYIDALRQAGVRTVVFCFSERVKTPVFFMNLPTDTKIWVLPALGSYLVLRRRMHKPYGLTTQETFGKVPGLLRRPIYTAFRALAPYLATPIGLLAGELRREGCNAILCQEYEYARFDVCVLLGMLLRMPVFATFQGGNSHLTRFEGLLRPFTIKACAGLIIAAQTEIERVRTSYHIPSQKIAHIFNPIDLSMWGVADRSVTRAELGIRNTARVVVWHGRVDIHRKGLDILLEAWRRICDVRKGQDLKLLLIGTGDDAEELQRRIMDMQLPGVIWINKYLLDRSAIRRYLSAADVYTLPSRHEGFPVAPVEAMACGLPVVAADAPGIPDILQGGEISGGIIVPRGDPAALALALGRILDNTSSGRELGLCARRRAETCFSLQAVGNQLRAFLADRGFAADKWERDMGL